VFLSLQPHNKDDDTDIPTKAVRFVVPKQTRFAKDTSHCCDNDLKDCALNLCTDHTDLNNALVKCRELKQSTPIMETGTMLSQDTAQKALA